MIDAIYEIDAQTYRPQRWAGSPWSTTTQHGGPVNGIFAREAEIVADQTGMQIARLTVDLFKAVPMVALIAETRIVREGKRITALETILHPTDDPRPVSRSTALLLRPTEHQREPWKSPETRPPSFEDTPPARRLARDLPYELPPGFHERVEIRSGRDDHGGYIWITTPLALVAGESISDLQRASALTDMTLGSQMRMAAHQRATEDPEAFKAARPFLLINTDTTIYWERPFVGRALGLRPALLTEDRGIGAAEAILYDERGRVGRSLQSALLQSPNQSNPAKPSAS